MLQYELYEDPFAIDGILKLPYLPPDSCSAWFTLELDHEPAYFALAEVHKDGGLSELIEPEFFHLGSTEVPLPDIGSPDNSTTVSEVGEPYGTPHDAISVPEEIEDVWALPDVTQAHKSSRLLGWEDFLDPHQVVHSPLYLSEAGPSGFDTALARIAAEDGHSIPSQAARPDVFLCSLFELGLGIDSTFFRYDNEVGGYMQRVGSFALSGHSQTIKDAIVTRFLLIGNQMKTLQAFIDGVSARTENAIVSSLAAVISTITYVIKERLQRERAQIQTTLQLQEAFEKAGILVEYLVGLIKLVNPAQSYDDITIAITLSSQQAAIERPWLEDLLHHLVARTGTPFVTGIQRSTGIGGVFLSVEETLPPVEQSPDDVVVCDLPVSSVLPSDLTQAVSVSSRCLKLLEAHQPDHPLLALHMQQSKDVLISWQCSWEGINRVQARADKYEQNLREVILLYSRGTEDIVKGEDKFVDEARFHAGSISTHNVHEELMSLDSECRFDRYLGSDRTVKEDQLAQYTMAIFEVEPGTSSSTALKPFISESLPLSLAPYVTAQSRLLSYSVLNLIIKEANLLSHLTSLHRFYLLSDGPFASRLSQALFDSGLSSGEGRRKQRNNTGLRLQSRDTWPPASSELSLILLGILPDDSSDTLSFLTSIRDLSDDDLEKCRDADSIHALDFLRLQYKPPNTLIEEVITPMSLHNYDKIFNHLLRLLRLKSVAQDLIREVSTRPGRAAQSRRKDQKFRVEIQHFAVTLADHAANIAVGIPWQKLIHTIRKVEIAIEKGDFDQVIELAGGLQHLKTLHEDTLDEITRALLLTGKQVEVRTLLEDLFGLILRYAAVLREGDDDDDATYYDEKVREMREQFRRKVNKFVRYLRSQSSSGSSSKDRDGAVFEQLWVRLDFCGYYQGVRGK